jgi:predicted amidophosphoribosyltransferase
MYKRIGEIMICPKCKLKINKIEIINKEGRLYCPECGERLNPNLAKHLCMKLMYNLVNGKG